MVAELEGQVLRRGHGAARGEDALYDGVGGHVQVHDRPAQGAGLRKVAPEIVGGVVLDAHGAEHRDEAGVVPLRGDDPGLADYLGGELVVAHARAGEDGQLLPAYERAGGVYGADAREDEAPGVLAGDGVYGGAVYVCGAPRRRPRSGRLWAGRAVKHAAEYLVREGDGHRLAEKARAGALHIYAAGALEDLDDDAVALYEDDLPRRRLPSGRSISASSS